MTFSVFTAASVTLQSSAGNKGEGVSVNCKSSKDVKINAKRHVSMLNVNYSNLSNNKQLKFLDLLEHFKVCGFV